jgi:hypothetical protein
VLIAGQDGSADQPFAATGLRRVRLAADLQSIKVLQRGH